MENKIIHLSFDYRKLEKISLLLIYALFSFYFLINGEGLFAEWDSSWTFTSIIYLLGVALFLGVQEQLPSELESKISYNIVGLLGVFLFLTVFFVVLYDLGIYFQGVSPLPLDMVLPTLVFQLVVVVASEEIIFRGVIFRSFYKIFGLISAVLISSIAFSVFHLVAYGGNIGSLVTAFAMGCILAYCVYRYNLGVAIGIHWAWNCFLLGATVI